MLTWIYTDKKLMFTMKCKTTGWCAVAFTTGDGSGMRDYDIALGGVSSNGNNYLYVRWMDFIQYKELHLTDVRWAISLNSFPKFTLTAEQMPITNGLYDSEITMATIIIVILCSHSPIMM